MVEGIRSWHRRRVHAERRRRSARTALAVTQGGRPARLVGQSSPMDSLDLSTFTGFLIRRAQQAHVAVWQREVSAEVTSVQFGVLNLLHRFPGASQRDLCDGLDLDRSTIADIVSRLETSGLIERVRDARDRRRNILHRSERGESELLALMPRAHRVDHVLTDTLSPSDRAELQRLLTALLDAPDVREVIRDAPLPGL